MQKAMRAGKGGLGWDHNILRLNGDGVAVAAYLFNAGIYVGNAEGYVAQGTLTAYVGRIGKDLKQTCPCVQHGGTTVALAPRAHDGET